MIRPCRAPGSLRLRWLVPLLAAIGLAACSAPPERTEPPPHISVLDTRQGPSGPAKVAESGGVRYYLGDNYFQADVIEFLHNRIALHGPTPPSDVSLEVTRIELSVFDPEGRGAVGVLPPGEGGGGYRPAPGPLVFDFHDPQSPKPIRSEIGYRVDGREYRERLSAKAQPATLREQMGQLYEATIDRVIARLSGAGDSG